MTAIANCYLKQSNSNEIMNLKQIGNLSELNRSRSDQNRIRKNTEIPIDQKLAHNHGSPM